MSRGFYLRAVMVREDWVSDLGDISFGIILFGVGYLREWSLGVLLFSRFL